MSKLKETQTQERNPQHQGEPSSTESWEMTKKTNKNMRETELIELNQIGVIQMKC